MRADPQIPTGRITRLRGPRRYTGVFSPEALLEASHVNVKAENFSREGMLRGELFGTPDALLPWILGHRAIMGLRLVAGNCVDLGVSSGYITFRRLTAGNGRDYSFRSMGCGSAARFFFAVVTNCE